MTLLVDLTGKSFGRLLVMEHAGSNLRGQSRWLCQCVCGTQKVIASTDLKRGNARSCGCLRREMSRKRRMKHGCASGSKTADYHSWLAMLKRCTNPNEPAFPDYGGRGIMVCDRWRNSFESFLADMGPRPRGLTLERVDNDGNYEPGNCVWGTRKQQSRNRRSTKLDMRKVELIRAQLQAGASGREIAEEFGVSPVTISQIKRGATWMLRFCSMSAAAPDWL